MYYWQVIWDLRLLTLDSQSTSHKPRLVSPRLGLVQSHTWLPRSCMVRSTHQPLVTCLLQELFFLFFTLASPLLEKQPPMINGTATSGLANTTNSGTSILAISPQASTQTPSRLWSMGWLLAIQMKDFTWLMSWDMLGCKMKMSPPYRRPNSFSQREADNLLAQPTNS